MKRLATWVLTTVAVAGMTGAAAAAESTDRPTGFSSATESSASKGKTGDTADCPIKKTVDGKTFCFQNDPALAKQQGGQ